MQALVSIKSFLLENVDQKPSLCFVRFSFLRRSSPSESLKAQNLELESFRFYSMMMSLCTCRNFCSWDPIFTKNEYLSGICHLVPSWWFTFSRGWLGPCPFYASLERNRRKLRAFFHMLAKTSSFRAADGCMVVEGFLKLKCFKNAKLGTLQRLKHDARIGLIK